jgi:hypothetical protein
LHNFVIQPGFLHACAFRRGADSLDGDDFLAGRLARRQQATAHWLAIQLHGAGAALRDAAAEFGAGQPNHITQNPQQRHVVWQIERMTLPVNVKRKHPASKANHPIDKSFLLLFCKKEGRLFCKKGKRLPRLGA